MLKRTDVGMGGGITLLLFVFTFLPLLAVILNAILPGIFFGDIQFNGVGVLLEIFERPLWYVSLKNSLILGIGAASLGTIFGGVLAAVRSRWDYAAGRLLDITVWVLLIAPSFIIAQGWVLFAGAQGLAASWLGWTWISELIFQPFGLVLVMGLTKFPLAYLTVSAAMEWNVAQLGNAARLNGARPLTVWRTVELPLVMPAYVAGWILVFIDTIGDFGLPAALATVYRFPTLTYSIYSAIHQSPVRFDMAGVLAFYLVLILAVAMALLFVAMRRSRVDFLTSRAVRVERKKPRRSWSLNMGTFAVVVVCLGVPIGTSVAVSFMSNMGDGLALHNLTFSHYQSVINGGDSIDHAQLPIWRSLGNSLTIAGISALISMALGFVTAYMLTFTSFRFKGAIHLFSIVSLAVPGIVLGIGYIFVWNQKWLEPIGLHLYGQPILLIIAAVAGAIPYAVRVQLGALANLSPSLLKAASVQGASTVTRMLTIVLPIVRLSVLVATLTAFATSVFDLATAAMLRPPNFDLMPLVIDKAFEFSQYGYATAATVLGGGVVVSIILIVQFAGKFGFGWLDRRLKKGAEKFEADTGSEWRSQGVRADQGT